MDAARRAFTFVKDHPRVFIGVQAAVLAIFFGFIGWALRGSFKDAGDDLRNADPLLFTLACVALAAYYLVFVFGWMRILADWDLHISYPAALRAEMVSMLAKYVPGGVWTPAARVVAARRAGITDGALVTVSILVEAGVSAVAGVIVFVVSLAWMDDVNAPIVPIVLFAVVVTALLHPKVFCPLASRVLRKLGHRSLPPLRTSTMAFLFVGDRRGCALAPAAFGRRAPGHLVGRLPRRHGRRRRDRRGALRVRALRPRPARGVDVRADARGRLARRGARRDGPEPRRDHARRGAAARRGRRHPASRRRRGA
jgi:hypothetical protein